MIIKLLKKLRPGKIVLTLILTILLVLLEIYLIKKGVNYNPTQTVLTANCDIKKGTAITQELLTQKEFNIINIPEGAIRDTNTVKGKIALADISKGQFIISKTLDNSFDEYKLTEKEALITLKFSSPDQANVYLMDKGELVELIFIPKDDKEEELDFERMKVKVVEITDTSLNKIDSDLFNRSSATYVTFITSKDDAEFISRVKNKGIFEIFDTND